MRRHPCPRRLHLPAAEGLEQVQRCHPDARQLLRCHLRAVSAAESAEPAPVISPAQLLRQLHRHPCPWRLHLPAAEGLGQVLRCRPDARQLLRGHLREVPAEAGQPPAGQTPTVATMPPATDSEPSPSCYVPRPLLVLLSMHRLHPFWPALLLDVGLMAWNQRLWKFVDHPKQLLRAVLWPLWWRRRWQRRRSLQRNCQQQQRRHQRQRICHQHQQWGRQQQPRHGFSHRLGLGSMMVCFLITLLRCSSVPP